MLEWIQQGTVAVWQAGLFGLAGYLVGLFTFTVWAICAIGKKPIPDSFEEMADKVESRVPFVATKPTPAQLDLLSPAPRRRRSQLIDAKECAKRLGVSTRFIYDHHEEWPFTVRLGVRAIRFDKAMLLEYIAQRKAAKS